MTCKHKNDLKYRKDADIHECTKCDEEFLIMSD